MRLMLCVLGGWCFIGDIITMPKSNSEPQTIISTRGSRLKKKLRWVEQRTQRAADYYSKTKKEDLKSAKRIYLQKIGETEQVQPNRKRPRQGEEEEDESRPLRRLIQLKQHVYRDESESQQAFNYLAEEASSPQSQSSDSLSSQPHYELTALHLAALEVQRIIDGCLDFHLNSRNRRSLTRGDLIDYLKTTKYALNPDRYLRIIAAYNRHAYRWEGDRIYCRTLTGREVQERVEVTRERMKRKQVEGLFL